MTVASSVTSHIRFLVLCFGFFTLVSCGGNSSSDSAVGSVQPLAAPGAATLTLTSTSTKALNFVWASVADAETYQLERNVANTGWVNIGNTLSSTNTSTSHVIAVHLTQWDNTVYRLRACNTTGCSISNELSVFDQMVQSIGYLKASNADALDEFGFPVAISGDGNTIVVASQEERSNATGINGNQADNSAIDAGAVYVFVRSGTTWVQQAYLKASNSSPGDLFGNSLSLSYDGSTLAVGAPLEDSNATGANGNQTDDSAPSSGATYVFVRTGVSWTQQAYIKSSNTEAGDVFGMSVALSANGNTLAVSATGEASNATGTNGNELDNSAQNSGAVYVFSRSGTAWTQDAYIKASNTETNDLFGAKVALSADGSILAVGAMREASSSTGINGNQTDNSSPFAGAAYVFSRSGMSWAQQAYIKASNTGDFDRFGGAIALSSDGLTLAVGAFAEASGSTGVGGNQADNSADNAGAVYVFRRSGSAWAQQAYIKASNSESFDQFGTSVALSADGSLLAVGSPREASNAIAVNRDQTNNSAQFSGAVYIYSREGSSWHPISYVKPSNTRSGSRFGDSTALSSDGATLAVGAYGESSSAVGIGGDQANTSSPSAGAVYIY